MLILTFFALKPIVNSFHNKYMSYMSVFIVYLMTFYKNESNKKGIKCRKRKIDINSKCMKQI